MGSCGTSCGPACAPPRRPSGSRSAAICPSTRPASCCVASCATSWPPRSAEREAVTDHVGGRWFEELTPGLVDRKSVGEGKRLAGRVDLGGRRFIKKKKIKRQDT